jgi:hypothetical protein
MDRCIGGRSSGGERSHAPKLKRGFHNKFLVPLSSICYQLDLEVDGVLQGGICMPYMQVDGESWSQYSLEEVLVLVELIWKGGKGSDG